MADPDEGETTLLADFAPGETTRYRASWSRSDRFVLAAMALGPVFGAFVLVDVEGGLAWGRLWFVLPAVVLYEALLYRLFRKNRDLLDSYAGWELTSEGIRFPTRRDKETKELGRRFVPYDDVDAVYFEGTPRLVSLVWPTMPARVRAKYGDRAPRALDDYVVIVEGSGEHTAIEKDDVEDVEAVKAALRDVGVKVVG